jgi:hypothetical protein
VARTTADLVIAFCTSAMNRRWQLEYTLAENLQRLRGSRHFLALCDFNSGDDLEKLARDHADSVQAGRLIYFRTQEPDHYHSSRAKNLAHRLALRRRPDVLFNLDADNFISGETLRLVSKTFRADRRSCLHHWSGTNGDGTSGRIALSARDWKKVGGYDEALLGASWQDIDLLIRSRAAGVTYVHRCEGIRAPIPNSMQEKVANLENGRRARDAHSMYADLWHQNFCLSMARPVRLSLAHQQRYRGVENFSEPRVI